MQLLCDIPDLLTKHELLSNYNVIKVRNHIIGHTLHTMFLTKRKIISVINHNQTHTHCSAWEGVVELLGKE